MLCQERFLVDKRLLTIVRNEDDCIFGALALGNGINDLVVPSQHVSCIASKPQDFQALTAKHRRKEGKAGARSALQAR